MSNPEVHSKDPIEKTNTLSERLNRLQSDLERAKPEWKKELRRQILELRRELNRTQQFTSIANNKISEWKESLDKLSASDLMKIDKQTWLRRWEFLSKSFLYKRTIDKKDGMEYEEASDGKNLKEWDVLYVDFWKNQSAESKIWIGDFLPKEVQVVSITDTQWAVRTWKRSIQWNKVWYYDERWYIPVYNGYTVEIPEKSKVEEYLKLSNPEIKLSDNEDEENSSKDNFIKIAENYERIGTVWPWNLAERQEFQTKVTTLAKQMETEYWIPWQVIYAQSALESWWGKHTPGNNYFWIKWWTRSYTTKEEINGQIVEVEANFRDYPSMEASFRDHSETIKKRWPEAIWTTDPIEFVRILVANPVKKYATDSDYVSTITSIINWYDRLAWAKPDVLELIWTTSPNQVITAWEKRLNLPYVWWRSDQNAVDCSWFISQIMRDTWVATPWFRDTAAWLKKFTREIDSSSIQTWDFMFWWWPHMYSWTPTYNHIAIVIGKNPDWTVNILDASWPNSGEWKVSYRNNIKVESKHSFWRPAFYTA
jgi:flagellum-specific peptidoglycan hydrolase FlgJ